MQSVLDTIDDVFRREFGLEPPPSDVDLIDAGLLDSLMLVVLLSELEAEFSIHIPLEDLNVDEVRTLARLGGLVDRLRPEHPGETARPDDELVLLLRDGSHSAPLFLMTGVGGTPLGLRKLAHAIRTTRPIYAVGPLERLQNGAPLRVEDMAEAYAHAIQTVQGSRPCVLGGVSLGGLVAYETARQLRAASQPVDHVILLDTRPGPQSLTKSAYWRFRITQPWRVLSYVVSDPKTRLPDAGRRAYVRFMTWLRSGLRSGNRLPRGSSPSSRVIDLAGQRYRPGAYGGDVTLFVTTDRALNNLDPESVWARSVGGEFTVKRIPGRHADFLHPSRVETVAALFTSLLDSA